MHPHEQLIARLFEGLHNHKPDEMAECYRDDATFHDIAFDLRGKRQIQAMWKMICLPTKEDLPSTIEVTVKLIKAKGDGVRAEVVEHYRMRDKDKYGRSVDNSITSIFEFHQDGRISSHKDDCDSVAWAKQAMGPLVGSIVGRIGWLRRWLAMRKLRRAYLDAFRDD